MTSAEDYGLFRTSGTFLAINLAEPLMALGRWDEAVEVIEHARELSPPPINQASLDVVAGLIAADRGDATTAARWLAASRAVLDNAAVKDQHHLPLAQLQIDVATAARDGSAALAATADALGRYDLASCLTRYAWPVLLSGARACLLALGQAAARRDGALVDSATALLDRLRPVAGELRAYGPVQRACQLTFTALVRQAGQVPGQPVPDGLRAGWDAAADAWSAVRQPHPQAWALTAAAGAAMAEGDRDGAATRLRHAATLAAGLCAAPLSDQIARLSRRVLRPVGAGPVQIRRAGRRTPHRHQAALRSVPPRRSA